jgi:hypothetical protein
LIDDGGSLSVRALKEVEKFYAVSIENKMNMKEQMMPLTSIPFWQG